MTVRFTSTESKFFAVKELCYVSPLLKTRVEITFRKYPPNPRGHIQDTPHVFVLTFLSFTVDLDYFLTTCMPHALGSLEHLPKTPFPAIQKDKEVLPYSRIRGWSKKMSRGLEQCMAPPCSFSWYQQLWLQWPQYFVSAYGELSATVRDLFLCRLSYPACTRPLLSPHCPRGMNSTLPYHSPRSSQSSSDRIHIVLLSFSFN